MVSNNGRIKDLLKTMRKLILGLSSCRVVVSKKLAQRIPIGNAATKLQRRRFYLRAAMKNLPSSFT